MHKAYRSTDLILQRMESQLPNCLLYIFFLIVQTSTVAFLGCAPKQMTLNEAKQTAISMRGKSFVPPPRSINDILGVIERDSTKEALIEKGWGKLLKAELSANAPKNEIIEFYRKRGHAAFVLGAYIQSRDDLQKAYDLSGPENVKAGVVSPLGASEQKLGNFDKAAALFSLSKDRQLGFSHYSQLTSLFGSAGYFEKADRVANEGINYFRKQSNLSSLEELYKARLEYYILGMRAKYKEAEPIIRKATTAALAIRPYRYDIVKWERISLVLNMCAQNRWVEAELEARKTIDETIDVFGTKSIHSLTAMKVFSQVLLGQGRLIDAEKVIRLVIRGYEQSDFPSTSEGFCDSIDILGRILVAKCDYSSSMKQYDFFLGMKNLSSYHYDKYYSRNPNVMLALIMTGRTEEAMELIDSAYQRSEEFIGKNHPLNAEILAMRGMVNNLHNNLESAYRDFLDSIPLMATSKTYAENRLSKHRFTIILDSYLDLLSKLKGSLIEGSLSISAPTKAFEISTLLSDSAVQAAVLDSSIRMTIEDPALIELTRTEQDIQFQITAYQNLIQENLSRPLGDSNRKGINNVKGMLDKLITAREIIFEELQRRFPNYANLVHAQVPSLADVQSRLKLDEVIISICSAENSTYVFVVSQTGPPEMVSVPINKNKLENLVSALKKSISPISDRLGQLPAYDFKKSYELYSLLLKPVESAWKNSKHIILAISGPLAQLPFTVITTGPFHFEKDEEVLFSNYRDAPWLIRRIAINTVPSVSSFVALRSVPSAVSAKAAFAGFGDPFFNKMQMAQALNEKKMHSTTNLAENTKLDIRGIRLTDDGNLDDKNLVSCTIEKLERLPDTADELMSIAESLSANSDRDVYLGRRASEKQVKSMNLSDRRVVAFASHALVPYDLDGLDQPAIALAAPSVTGDEDDGLLTMAEILDLKLNADWVVLSACNTGAAEGAGAEAVSGLGRAFFYAGTRALLVSMWPVETSSAKKLTTSLFRHQKENPALSKAQAHQMAMLELIEGPGMRDEGGRIIASYAHPFFWAPFIIVGDNGMTNLN
jgi:CHAT domain-containing protein